LVGRVVNARNVLIKALPNIARLDMVERCIGGSDSGIVLLKMLKQNTLGILNGNGIGILRECLRDLP
jgi:hypothetical protein